MFKYLIMYFMSEVLKGESGKILILMYYFHEKNALESNTLNNF